MNLPCSKESSSDIDFKLKEGWLFYKEHSREDTAL